MRGNLARQFLPALVIFRWVGPAFFFTLLERPSNAIGLGMAGKSFRHKAQFHERSNMRLRVGVKDLVENGPAIDWLSACVFAVNVCRTPLQVRLAIAARQQEVGTYVHRYGSEIV